MKMISIFKTAFSLSVLYSSVCAAATITNFGTTADSDGGWDWNQSTSTISGVEASGALLFSSTVLNLDLTGSDAISLTANVSGAAPANGFTFQIEDASGKTAFSVFDWASFAGGATVTVIFNNVAAGFDFANVTNWNLLSGSSGASINAVLSSASASAIPEPSTYAALLGLTSVGICVWRKRRKA